MDTSRRSPEKYHADMPVTSSFNSDHRRSQIIEITPVAETRWQYLRRYFTTKEGWIGNYVFSSLSNRQNLEYNSIRFRILAIKTVVLT